MLTKAEVERKAIEYVKRREHKDNPRKSPHGSGYDILTDRKRIEVKGVSHGIHAILNNHNLKAFDRYHNYYLYVVSFHTGKPQLAIFTKTKIWKKHVPARTWYIPLRKADFKG